MMDVERICAEYLRSVSPIAQRIAEDIDSVRIAYKELWDTLDAKNKNQVVDEALIDPAAVVKYANEDKENTFDVEPLSNFSWFTQSQLNLFTFLPSHICETSRPRRIPPVKCSDILSPQKKKITSPQPTQHDNMSVVIKSPKEKLLAKGRSLLVKSSPVSQEKVDGHHHDQGNNGNSQKITATIAKPKNPPPPPPPKCAKPESKALLDQDDIPKTGFDFLDNW